MNDEVDWWDAPHGVPQHRSRTDDAAALPEAPEGLLYPELFRTAEFELAALQRFTTPPAEAYRPMEVIVAHGAALAREVERAWHGDFQGYVRQVAMDSAMRIRDLPDEVLQALFALASNHGRGLDRAASPDAVRMDRHTFLRRGFL